MAIVDTLNADRFADRIMQIRPDNFSNTGLYALFDYLDGLSDDTETPIEFDPIGICCEYSELEGQELIDQYGHLTELDADADADDQAKELAEFIEDYTTVIKLDNGGYIIADF